MWALLTSLKVGLQVMNGMFLSLTSVLLNGAVLVAELHAWATCGLELLEIRTLRLYDATRMKIPGFKFRDKD